MLARTIPLEALNRRSLHFINWTVCRIARGIKPILVHKTVSSKWICVGFWGKPKPHDGLEGFISFDFAAWEMRADLETLSGSQLTCRLQRCSINHREFLEPAIKCHLIAFAHQRLPFWCKRRKKSCRRRLNLVLGQLKNCFYDLACIISVGPTIVVPIAMKLETFLQSARRCVSLRAPFVITNCSW